MQIEIFSDVVCPWCYIGKRRLDSVLQMPVGEGVALRWRPYQLHPDLPEQGMDRRRYLQARYGAQADLSRIPQRILEEAEEGWPQIQLRRHQTAAQYLPGPPSAGVRRRGRPST